MNNTEYKELIEKLNNIEAIAYGYNINGEVLGMDCSDFEQIMVDSAVAITELMEILAKVTAERDAAISDLYEARSCKTCALQFSDDCLLEECFEPCGAVLCENTPYKWRGIQEVQNDE